MLVRAALAPWDLGRAGGWWWPDGGRSFRPRDLTNPVMAAPGAFPQPSSVSAVLIKGTSVEDGGVALAAQVVFAAGASAATAADFAARLKCGSGLDAWTVIGRRAWSSRYAELLLTRRSTPKAMFPPAVFGKVHVEYLTASTFLVSMSAAFSAVLHLGP